MKLDPDLRFEVKAWELVVAWVIATAIMVLIVVIMCWVI